MRGFVLFLAIGLGIAAPVSLPGAPVPQQEPSTSSPLPRGSFFSGFIVSCSATEVTVNRKGLGKETAAKRTFSIDGTTKIEGLLKPGAHVTVRFMGEETTARAVHIIVR